jgi:hypothetical protein
MACALGGQWQELAEWWLQLQFVTDGEMVTHLGCVAILTHTRITPHAPDIGLVRLRRY